MLRSSVLLYSGKILCAPYINANAYYRMCIEAQQYP
jgi:hypothetical protein